MGPVPHAHAPLWATLPHRHIVRVWYELRPSTPEALGFYRPLTHDSIDPSSSQLQARSKDIKISFLLDAFPERGGATRGYPSDKDAENALIKELSSPVTLQTLCIGRRQSPRPPNCSHATAQRFTQGLFNAVHTHAQIILQLLR